jgi:hypothetical protein
MRTDSDCWTGSHADEVIPGLRAAIATLSNGFARTPTSHYASLDIDAFAAEVP